MAALLPACAGREPERPVVDRFNVVLYLIDTLRADRLGVYGHQAPTSPVLDSLAAEGVVFERAYAMDTRTLGSVPSLLTSLHTASHGIKEYGDTLAPDVVTLASAMSDAGYDTAALITNVVAGRLVRLDRGFDLFRYLRDPAGRLSFPDEEFFQWLDRPRTRPFFAYVHTGEPHRPYVPPPPFDTMFDPGYRGRVKGTFGGKNGYENAKDPRDVAHVRALYDGEVRFADAGLGRLVDGLKARGLLGRTLLVVTADHGEELQDHGGWNHGHTVYDELLRVPLILAGPGVPRGRRVREPIQLIDVAPTVLERVGVRPPDAFEGRSVLDLVDGGRAEQVDDKEIYTQSTQAPTRAVLIRGGFKVILDQQKGLEAPDAALELYDLRNDPAEARNLAPVQPERAAALRARLRARMETSAPGRAGAREALTADDVEKLRELGYVE